MQLNDIMKRAASAYPDEYILSFWDEERQCAVPCEGAGDSLALFIAWELYETFDPDETRLSPLLGEQWLLLLQV